MTQRLAYGPPWEDAGYVFTRPNGLPAISPEIAKAFTALVRENELPHLTLHGLRHAYASLGLQARVDMKVVSQSLGHSTIGITSDLYTHVLEKNKSEHAHKIAGLLKRGA